MTWSPPRCRRPWRGRLLALSLWGANRSADALEMLRLHRHHLAEETGLDPEPTIVALEQAIREQRPEFGDGDGSPGAFRPGPGVAAASIRPAQLPWASATFAGRSDQLSQLSAQARSGDGTVLAVIAGSGGVGKTMLALRWAHEVADRYPDGQLFADLRGYGPSAAPAEPGDILGGFLLALGVPDGGVPPGPAERTALFRTVVAGRRLLLVLDNARDAEQVRPLLPGTPGCAVVVTSRSGLAGLVVAEGARPVPLDAFTDDEARDYLRVRLGAEIADADPAERDAVIARCGGLPLALAVVCARAASLPLATVMAELAEEQGLDAFAAPGVTHDVRSVFSWSYRCLPDEAAELFRHLALHPGPDVSLAAATAMAGGDRAATRRLLRTLCDAHLLTERRPGRFVFHDLIRAYATELADRLDPPEHRRQPLRRLAEHYLFSADNMCKVVFPYPVGDRFGPAPPGVAPVGFADAETALAWMDAEYENAMSVALLFPDLVGGFVWALGTYQQNLRFHLDHSIRLCRVALEVAADRNDAVHTGYLHYVIARALVRLDRRAEARGHLEQAIAVGRTTADPVRTANGLLALSLCIIGEHEIPTAEEAAEAYPYAVEAREIYRAMNDDVGRGEEANTLHPIGWYHFYQPAGRDEALRYFRDAIELGYATSDPMMVASAWLNLGLMLRHGGDPVAAVDAFERALTSYADMPELRLGPLAELYVCFREMGEAGKARRIRSEARELLRTARHPDVARVAGKLDIPVAVAAGRPSRPDHDGGRTTS